MHTHARSDRIAASYSVYTLHRVRILLGETPALLAVFTLAALPGIQRIVLHCTLLAKREHTVYRHTPSLSLQPAIAASARTAAAPPPAKPFT